MSVNQTDTLVALGVQLLSLLATATWAKGKSKQIELRPLILVGLALMGRILIMRMRDFLLSLNRPFPSSPQPPFQSEAKCEFFVMKISFHSY